MEQLANDGDGFYAYVDDIKETERIFVAQADFSAEFATNDPHFQLTVVAAQYAEILRESYWAKDAGTTLANVSRDARRVAEYLPHDVDVQEFAQLTMQAIELRTTQ